MGILNVTPDSFSDGGSYLAPDAAIARAHEMVAQGATLIDIGGASSRPQGKAYGAGADPVSVDDELERILPVIRGIVQSLPEALVSVDTYHEAVAAAVLAEGVHLINDITGLRHSPGIAALVANCGAGLVLMHSHGQVGSMPHAGLYDDVVSEVANFLKSAVVVAETAGVKSILLDPGFGFGKSVDDNLRLVNGIDVLTELGYPALIGVSRKSSIGAALQTGSEQVPPDSRLFGGLGATAAAVVRGASIVRTHDVGPTVEFIRVLVKTLRSDPGAAYLDNSIRRSPQNTALT